MFFKQVRRNATKSRKNNGLFFGSLIIAIVAFYTLLSLESQDVMRFLKTIESDAVSKLMLMIPSVYVISLFFVFFLVYFAYRYQLDNRKKEFGLYLMLGMKRSKLFAMLMTETLWNSLVSILIGLPISLLLTEGISLATVKLVGLGILGHKISFSISAVLSTVLGFVFIQMIAMLCLCIELSRKEPMQLLRTDSPDKQVSISKKKSWCCFLFGVLFLLIAYTVGILMLRSFNLIIVLIILIFGGVGTFLLYCGMGVIIGMHIQKKSPSKSGLFVFTGRQIQENVLYEYKALAISSLLILMALSCVSFGIGIASVRGSESTRNVDFSVDCSEEAISKFVGMDANKSAISTYYPMYVDHLDTESHEFVWGIVEALETQHETSLRNNIIENLSGPSNYPYFISENSYNDLLKSMGKEPLHLEKNQVALYTSDRDSREFTDILSGALKTGAYVEIDDARYELLPNLYCDNIVADRKITLYTALIISDKLYQNLFADSGEPFCWNVLLRDGLVKKEGLMQAIQTMEKSLSAEGLDYESYLGGIGRNLFFTVAASYLTIYLGILFVLIANTVIGLKFLMQLRSNKHRYLTLFMLGANVNALCSSAKKQIQLFFALVFGVSICSSVFAIWAMFTSFMKLPVGISIGRVILIAGIGFVLFIIVELVYIVIVERIGNKEICKISVTNRR